ncbi:hypothetical protein Bca4012_039093 [Brassica carinata]
MSQSPNAGHPPAFAITFGNRVWSPSSDRGLHPSASVLRGSPWSSLPRKRESHQAAIVVRVGWFPISSLCHENAVTTNPLSLLHRKPACRFHAMTCFESRPSSCSSPPDLQQLSRQSIGRRRGICSVVLAAGVVLCFRRFRFRSVTDLVCSAVGSVAVLIKRLSNLG